MPRAISNLALVCMLFFTANSFAAEKTLLTFTGTDGAYPYGGVILDRAGNLYGTTTFGGQYQQGTVYELTYNHGAWTQTVLYNFGSSPTDGALPDCNLVFDNAGNLYGTTESGGASGLGSVFELKHANGAWSEEILYSFTGGSDGAEPVAGVVFDQSGNILGTTQVGGKFRQGVVFVLHLENGTWQHHVLHAFTGGSDGGQPQASVTLDAAGNVYGTTSAGGKSAGVVFQLAQGTYKETVLHNFFTNPNDGAYPSASLTFDSAGNLFGTTSVGGKFSSGIVFELSPSGQGVKYSIIYNFTGGADGNTPLAGVTLDAAGNIYGTTFQGGAFGAGNIYELKPSNSGYTESTIYSFTGGADGLYPEAGDVLARSSSGILFGTTSGGGESQNLGSVVAVKP